MKLTIKEFLEKNNLSIKEASLKTGLSDNVIRRNLKGTYPVSANTRQVFKEVFDLDIVDVYDTKEKGEKMINNNVMKNETKNVKEEIITYDSSKNEKVVTHKSDIKQLKTRFELENEAIKKQIEALLHQSEIKEMKIALTQILSLNDEFFTRPDVVDTVKKLIKLSENEVIQEQNINAKTQNLVNDNSAFISDEYNNYYEDKQSQKLDELVEEDYYDDAEFEQNSGLTLEENVEEIDLDTSYEQDIIDDNSSELDFDEYNVSDDEFDIEDEENDFEEYLDEGDYEESLYDDFE